MQKRFAVVGSWTETPNVKMGLTVFEVKGHELIKLKNYFPEAKVGSCIYDEVRSVLYFVDEIQHPADRRIGGGGYVYAARFNRENSEITLLSKSKTFGVKPDYCCFDEERNHLIVVHHGSTRDTITRMKRNEDGTITSEVLYDDIPTVLFKLNEDGSIGDVCDYILHDGVNPAHENPAHIHSVYKSPEGRFFVASDKGMDRIWSYRIEGSVLKVINCLDVEFESDPRYGVFNKEAGLFYGTNEKKPFVSVYSYNEDEGITGKICDVKLLSGEIDKTEKITASDIIVTADKKRMYIALRRKNKLVYLEIDEKGIPVLKRSVDIGGNNTRGLALNPEEDRIYCCNCESDQISVFKSDKEHYLERTDEDIVMNCPGNMLFI